MTIKENIELIENDIKKYSKDGANLLCVTKTHGIDTIKTVYDLGYRDFGENKVQELLEKKQELPKDIRWHLIGHLQRNKVKKIIGEVFLIHSVDSFRLLEEIDKVASKKNLIQDILIQVNISKEDTKGGFYIEELENLFKNIEQFRNVRVLGLMTIAPNIEDEQYISSVFRELKKIFDKLSKLSYNNIDMKYISMGMTNDYILALKEGSNIIRIGSKIFGKRVYK
ncbi:MAG: YggS family pyridoxal phosphate-dependent enzyme [Peptoniphilaceae bacterium]|nr:YggS family pyridoxal phosphate-dependent enzyme [Peptoniphilaceae bacterium]MDY6019583.1 YggS family pyridoxal phosphate-dependent enzyme [Anaerococcus sp.]